MPKSSSIPEGHEPLQGFVPVELKEKFRTAIRKRLPKGNRDFSAGLVAAIELWLEPGTSRSIGPTAISSVDVTPKGDDNKPTAVQIGGIHFEHGDIEWLRRMHRVLHSKIPVIVNAIKSNLEAFEYSVSERERLEERLEALDARLAEMAVSHGDTKLPAEGTDHTAEVRQLPVPQGHARSRGKKPDKGARKGHTG